MFVVSSRRIPIKIWLAKAKDIEASCLAQAENLASLPFAFKHISLMPDTHFGYGMPIGGVLATKGVVIPNAVGVDIGCGMGFVQTNIKVSELQNIETPNGELIRTIAHTIKRCIPTGMKGHKEMQVWNMLDNPPLEFEGMTLIEENLERAKYSLGTLGGGNHFIELQSDEEGNLCLMLHSGSRNFGYKIAGYYHELAKTLNERWHSSIPKEWDLAFLPLDSDEGQEYLKCMNFALEFSKENRSRMMMSAKNIIYNMIEKYAGIKGIEEGLTVNIHHNYADMENHFKENVIVHRKGAIRMREGELGIIPGSMGTASYIVKGLGNEQSFMSASHGAGRRMGRKQAEKNLDPLEQERLMEGIITTSKLKDILDECPGAYKKIEDVIENEADLVSVVLKLKPLASIKGESEG